MDINSAVGRENGLSDGDIAVILGGGEEGFSEPERLLLRMADALASTPANVSEELFAALRAHFTEEQLIELAAAAAQENYRARFNRTFDVGSDGLYCVLPQRSPGAADKAASVGAQTRSAGREQPSP